MRITEYSRRKRQSNNGSELTASRNEFSQVVTRPKGSPYLEWRSLSYLNYAPLNVHRCYSIILHRVVGADCAKLILLGRATKGATDIW